MKSTIVTLILLLSSSVFGQYKYVIYTDETPSQKAQDIITYFNQTPPFSEFDVEFTIESMSTEELGCDSSKSSDGRLVICDTRKIVRKAHRDDFDQAFVVSDAPQYGGSGGEAPVITASGDTPISMLTHEYMHHLGFCDEYEYTQAEADRYCTKRYIRSVLNISNVEPIPGGYASDQQARDLHSGQIKWYSDIESSTPISQGGLGTPGGYPNKVGLFPSPACNKKPKDFHLWQPMGEISIMENLRFPLSPFYEDQVRKALLAKGLKLKPTPASSSGASGAANPCEGHGVPISAPEGQLKNIGDVVKGVKKL